MGSVSLLTGIIHITDMTNTQEKEQSMNPIQKIWKVLSLSQRKNVFFLFILMFIGMGLELLGIGLIVPIVMLISQADLLDKYPMLLPFIELLGNPNQKELVIISMLALVSIYIIKNIFLGFTAWYKIRFTHTVGAMLSTKLFNVYLQQPYTFHLQQNSSNLIRNVLFEIGVFMGALAALMQLFSELLIVIGLSTALILIEPFSAFVVILVVGSAGYLFHRVTRLQVAKWGKSRYEHEGFKMLHLQQGLGGIKDVKLLGREKNFMNQYDTHNIKSAHVRLLMETLKQFPRLWLEILTIGGLAGIVISLLEQGKNLNIILPVLALFAAAAFRLMPSANNIIGAIQILRHDLVVINTIYAELLLGNFNNNKKSLKNIIFENTIELRNVSFQYEASNTPSLKNLSIIIHNGELIGFIGKSGAGKSTLVDVILGLIPPDSGVVCVDGHDVQENMRSWQNHIGYVPQTIYLTDDSLRRNIAFGLPDEEIDTAAVHRALEYAQMTKFVNTLPDGLETKVGERGVRLSGGQRQRIGIARALYHDPEVLVLDEATSSLDVKTEAGVMEAVQALHGSKTIIIVAHRLSTIKNCDRLYTLDKGQIKDEGAPEKLVSIN